MYEPVFKVLSIDQSLISTESALYMGEHIAHTLSIAPSPDDASEAFVKLAGTHQARGGLLVLPVGDVLIMRLCIQGIASPSVYLAVSKDNMETVEKAILGLINDFKVITLGVELTYKNDEGNNCANVTNTLSCSTERLIAVWLDMSPFLKEMETQSNLVIEPVQGNAASSF